MNDDVWSVDVYGWVCEWMIWIWCQSEVMGYIEWIGVWMRSWNHVESVDFVKMTVSMNGEYDL